MCAGVEIGGSRPRETDRQTDRQRAFSSSDTPGTLDADEGRGNGKKENWAKEGEGGGKRRVARPPELFEVRERTIGKW